MAVSTGYGPKSLNGHPQLCNQTFALSMCISLTHTHTRLQGPISHRVQVMLSQVMLTLATGRCVDFHCWLGNFDIYLETTISALKQTDPLTAQSCENQSSTSQYYSTEEVTLLILELGNLCNAKSNFSKFVDFCYQQLSRAFQTQLSPPFPKKQTWKTSSQAPHLSFSTKALIQI